MEKIDKTDLKILQILQENAQKTIKEIAKEINLSITPVHERIKRLENTGIIEKYVTILNRKKLGKWLIVYCQITLDKQTQNNFIEFETEVNKFQEVIECAVVSGSFDYLLKILVNDMDGFNEFYQQKLSTIESVAHINSLFVMKEVKQTNAIPLSH